MKRPLRILAKFLQTQAASGIFLLLATAITLLMANHHLFRGEYTTITHWLHLPVNDGLMVIFFFLIGLEIRREMDGGFLSSRRNALLPAIAAIGGMIVPALVYMSVAKDTPDIARGWAIPTATDIAFALAVLSLLGQRIPSSIRVFLLAIAVIDDIGAILIIAFFYSSTINIPYLAGASALIAMMYFANKRQISCVAVYLLLGIALAGALFMAGVHTTVAGVITAFFIPSSKKDNLIHHLHGPVAFGIMPLFAFVNAGLPLDNINLSALFAPLPFAIMAGLFIGKSLGVFTASWITIKSGLSAMPDESNWSMIYGMSLLCGIGFTMSLFIGILAFGTNGAAMTQTQLGVIAGSLLSSLAGYVFLRFCGSTKK